MADADSKEHGTSASTGNMITRLHPRKLYPRAHDARASIHEPAVYASRMALLRAAGKNFVLLQLLFFSLFCYIFGALYKQGQLVHRLNVLFVDYDGGAVGEAVRSAYRALEGDGFPALMERGVREYGDPEAMREHVCSIDYWGAIYVAPGASDAIEAALTGSAADYDKTAIMTYIWNEARYPAISDSLISANMALLASTARSIFASNTGSTNWTALLLPTPSASTFSIFADPWHLSSVNIQPTSQGTRLVYNTLVIILLMIQEFFYLGTLNQLYDMFKIYTRLHPHRIILFRNMISLTYCFVGSLCVTGTIWIFKTGWDVDGGRFMLTWCVLFLYAHLTFLTLDVFTVWLPPPFVPMALIMWLMLNIVSILLPFELMSDFYKWSYAMPAHEAYVTLINIWSRGCNPELRYSLPIMFAFEISSFILSALGIHRRCHYAIIRAEEEAKASQERLEAALAFERKKRAEEREKVLAMEKGAVREEGRETGSGSGSGVDVDVEEERRDRAEIEGLIGADAGRLRRLQTVHFGPSFGFGLGPGGEDESGGGAPLGTSTSRKTVA